MKRNRPRLPTGFTLAEAVIATVLIVLVILGTAGYRWRSSYDVQHSSTQLDAISVANLLCEGWRGRDGSEAYNPVAHLSPLLEITEIEPDLRFTEAVPYGYTLHGFYDIAIDGKTFGALLAWKQVAPGLRELNVGVIWSVREGELLETALDSQDYRDIHLYRLTTYANR